jgi:hypothetical protein
MPPPASRELELRLKIVADSQQGVAAMNQLAAAAQRVEMAGARAGAAISGRPAGPAGAAAAGGAGGMGFGGLGKAALGLFLGQQAVQRVGNIGGTLQDSFLTGDQKGRSILKELDPFGLVEAWDSASGRNDLMAREQLRHQQATVGLQGRLQAGAFGMQQNVSQAGLAARAAGLAGASPLLEGYSDRSTARGEREFQEKSRLLVVDREIAKSERESSAAAAQRVAAAKELQKIDTQLTALQRNRGVFTRNVGRGGSGPSRLRALDDLSEYDQEIGGVAAQRRAAAEQLRAAEAASAQSGARTAGLRATRLDTRAGLLESQAANSASAATRLGGMDPFRRAEAVNALQMLQAFGPDAIGPEQVALAQSVAPQTVQKILQQRGQRTGEFARLEQLAPGDVAGRADDLERRAAELRDEAVKIRLEAEKTVADVALESGKEFGSAVADAIRQMTQAAINEVKTQLLRGKAAT